MDITKSANGPPLSSFDHSGHQTALPTELLLKALDDARQKRTEIGKQVTVLEKTLAAIQEEEQILASLIALRRGEIPKSIGFLQSQKRNSATDSSVGQKAIDIVVEILQASKRPNHISDLMRQLADQAVIIPGSGTQSNLISHLRRDKRIVRPSRGMYGLAVWGLEEMPRRSKRTRKRRS